MSERTRIAWATSTFNPWLGCAKVSPGCDGCYAAVSTPARTLGVKWGVGEKRHLTSLANWEQPLAWDRKAAKSGQPWRVFCGSLCDVFDNEVSAAWRLNLGHLIWTTPHLTWMLLTKRIGNATQALRDFNWTHFPNNVWLGATVVNQEEADRDIPKLLAVPAAVRFLSIEPMLESINLQSLRAHNGAAPVRHNCLNGYSSDTPWGLVKNRLPDRFGRGKVDWVIVGGESDQPGHKARTFNIEWARPLVAQCKAAGVPVFVKQLGSHPRGWCAWNTPECVGSDEAARLRAENEDGDCVNCEADEQARPCEHYGRRCVVLTDRAGADPSEWPEDLRVREFPR